MKSTKKVTWHACQYRAHVNGLKLEVELDGAGFWWWCVAGGGAWDSGTEQFLGDAKAAAFRAAIMKEKP